MQDANKKNPHIPGKIVVLAGQEFEVPPLTFGQLRRLSKEIEILTTAKITASASIEQQEALLKVIHAALSRNYPDLTLEDMDDLIDMGNVLPTIEAVMSVSGFVKVSGTAQGGAESPLTGTQSTPT